MEDYISNGLIALIMGIGGAIAAFFKSFRFVHEGEEGCKLRFGRVVRNRDGAPWVIYPGFVWLIPWVDSLRYRHIRQQTLYLNRQEIYITGDLVFIVSAMVRMRVRDVYKALFEVDDLDSCVTDRCMAGLRDILQKKDHEGIRDTEAVSSELLCAMKEMEDQWGVEFLEVRLTSCAPDTTSAQTLAVKTSADMRVKAIQAAAKELGFNPLETQGLFSAIIGIPVMTNVATEKERSTYEMLRLHKQVMEKPDSDGGK